MEKKRNPRRLRWTLARALIVTVSLLWAGFVAILQNNRVEKLDTELTSHYVEAQDYLQNETIPYYQHAKATGAPDAEHALMRELSSMSVNGIQEKHGGAAQAVLLGDTIVRSQITWGYGGESATAAEYYLYFDEGLTDEGQLDFAAWMIQNRGGWAYTMNHHLRYPTNDEPADPKDALRARVSGVRIDDIAMQVQSIDLVTYDNMEERIFTADIPAECDTTVELANMQLFTALTPSWTAGNRKLDMPRMERDLSDYRKAQSYIDRQIAGEPYPVTSGHGRITYGPVEEGSAYWMATHCNTQLVVLREYWMQYLNTFLLATALLLTLSTHLSKKVTEPLETLSRDVATGRCQTDGAITELNTLAAAVNDAQDKLSQQLERERNFTRAAAHELKTPLAVLRAHAEALQEDIDPQKREQYLAVVLDEADRMAALTGNLLELSRLEGGAPLQREPVELSALVRDVFDRLALSMEQKGVAVSLQLTQTQVAGDAGRLQEAVSNLATNALRHCPAGKTIRVTLAREDAMAHLSVYNEGEPIPEEDLPHLWEPFYRGDKSRSRQSGGTGLGLTIVRATVAAHGGVCTVENTDGGVIFHLSLPLLETK